MSLKIYKSISEYAKGRLNQGATIVNFLTDWKTPCYVYQGKNLSFGRVIAVNNGIGTYAETSNATHIFENKKETFLIPYLQDKKLIFYGDIPIAMHAEKQLSQPFFSTFCIESGVNSIIEEFIKKGYQYILLKNLNAELFHKILDEQRKNARELEEESQSFYRNKLC